MPILVSYTQ
ncbi:unnamed protein product [Acanthoscelides obtectus]|uniref:Uncharacterized protein n=1 Tax=Acanthoscelides obtectus TaxID=200917 RepID=A0A9P0KYL7_ACAOB|nr:unnamed protein product [Acanthoscelides obtectus]CAK1623439.1 hypothetical protein AOBTE_LOCUS2004 [Acanthoscelides obtectus]